jgi:hypothetical protein
MKAKVTKSQVKQNFTTILSIGYCDIQYLTRFKNPFAYSSGQNGWSCDYYEVENTCLSTGYSPIGKNVDYKLIAKYEEKAKKIINNYDLDYKLKEKRVNKLLVEFINKCKETI